MSDKKTPVVALIMNVIKRSAKVMILEKHSH